MSSLANYFSSDLVGFFSYSRDDDKGSRGALSALRDAIQLELSAQLGRSEKNFRIWQDQAAIPVGTDWADEINRAISQSVFFIPIITPRVFTSENCAFEFQSFLARERDLRRADLVFPLLYIPVPELGDEKVWRKDPVLNIVGTRQYFDWQRLRFSPPGSTEVGIKIEQFCQNISKALRKPWENPDELHQRLQAEARQQAEQEERRARIAEEEERRKKAEIEAARAAKRERKRREEEAARIAEEEERRKAAQIEAARIAEEEERRKKAEIEAARIAEEEERRKAAQIEAARIAEEEERRKAAQIEAARIAEEEERRKAAQIEAAGIAEEEERRKAAQIEAARIAEEEERRKKAEIEAARAAKRERKRREEEAARIAAEERRRKAPQALEAATAANKERTDDTVSPTAVGRNEANVDQVLARPLGLAQVPNLQRSRAAVMIAGALAVLLIAGAVAFWPARKPMPVATNTTSTTLSPVPMPVPPAVPPQETRVATAVVSSPALTAQQRQELPTGKQVTTPTTSDSEILERASSLSPSEAAIQCESSDTVTRLIGCTAIINAKSRGESSTVSLADALDGRCSAYNVLSQFARGLEDCRASIAQDPRYMYAYNNLGTSLLGLGDARGAISAYTKSIELKPTFIYAYLGRGKAYAATGNAEMARKDFQYVLSVDLTNQQATDGIAALDNPENGGPAIKPLRLATPHNEPANPVNSAACHPSVPQMTDAVGGPLTPVTLKLTVTPKPLRSIAISPDGQTLASAGDDGVIRIWGATNLRWIRQLPTQDAPVYSVAFSDDSKLLASAGFDGSVRIWDAHSFAPLLTSFRASGDNGAVQQYGVAFEPGSNPRYVNSAGADGNVWIWRLTAGKAAIKRPSGNSVVRSLSFAPRGTGQFVSANFDGKIRFFESDKIDTVQASTDKVLRVAYSPDAKLVASAGSDLANKGVKVWNVANRSLFKAYNGHIGYAVSVAWSSDGSRIVSGGGAKDLSVRLWDVQSGSQLQSFPGHTADVEAVAFHPNQKWLISASEDGTMKLWDITSATKQPLLSVVGYDNGGHLAYAPNGCYTGSANAASYVKFVMKDSKGVERDAPGNSKEVLFVPGDSTTALLPQ